MSLKIGAFTFPFFPMRPFTGARLFDEAAIDAALALQANGELILQKKLNGDRGVLGVLDSTVYLANRHGSFYKMTCDNTADFSDLPSGTLIDGEIYKKKFYPFEAIQIGDNKLFMERDTQLRIDAAQRVCCDLGIDWLFDIPTKAWMLEQKAIADAGGDIVWEGVVGKAPRCKYLPMASETSESANWRRMKWI